METGIWSWLVSQLVGDGPDTFLGGGGDAALLSLPVKDS
jgi:hypothetical protein